ncbi:rod shape-determining protein MreC [Deinococcus arenicola]|uniref:Cell shape-determining protein MreC n=1 Tax=Deinococcus arenicola TaxID=2994950 RepID=A0ABU4DRE8_9DEIO|nr:rod shape-determining protein MreC [Deinococcus sp. ZS9-10]MDV6374654.1 rod shape-determining protein MreC [Deinococcus sp. ZS9-10]
MTGGRQFGLVFAGLLLLSMVLTRFQVVPPTALRSVTAPISLVGLVVADNLRRAVLSVNDRRDLRAVNASLQAENDVLRQRNEVLNREAARLKQLEIITGTQAPNAVGIAQVIAVDPSPLLSRLTLNRGTRDGVRIRMPVTVPGGLVGQITGVSASTATVVSLVDPESTVGVTLQNGGGGRGLAHGVPPDSLRAEFSRGVPIKEGDVLVTSSLGGVFPVGVRVGKVQQVLPLGPNDVNRSVIIKPAVDLGVVEDVTILEGL